jgi:hypothetical protein
MDLTQFERIKMEQKQERYGLLKIEGPRCKDQELHGGLLRKGRGTYIIMYRNPRVYLQNCQEGFMCRRWVLCRGL